MFYNSTYFLFLKSVELALLLYHIIQYISPYGLEIDLFR